MPESQGNPQKPEGRATTAAEEAPGSQPPYPALFAILPQVPRQPGVYLFRERGGRVLYVGKAVNLRHRLGSYLKAPERHDPKTAMMLRKLAEVQYLLTATEREALILERNLIKEHRPRYNVELKDDKNFLCLRLDLKEDFPALRFVRRFAPDGALYFGPYASASLARETVKVMKQVFGLRTCKERRLTFRPRPCLNAQLGRCLGPCAGWVTKEDYQQAAQEAVQFLKGRGRTLLKILHQEMTRAAAALDFEKAARLRDRMHAIRRTLERQDMARPHQKDQDIIGLARENGQALVLVLLVRQGLVTGSQEYFFPDMLPGSDLLGDFLKQYYQEGRPLPDEIVLPQDLPDRRLLGEIFGEQRGRPVRLLVVAGGGGTAAEGGAAGPTFSSLHNGGGEGGLKGGQGASGPPALPSTALLGSTERRRLAALAQENAREALRRRQAEPPPPDALEDLRSRLGWPNRLRKLACLDISTLQGNQAVGALVTFTDGLPDKSRNRRFKIRGVAGQDDFAMLREVVGRHFGKGEVEAPDLLVVDGGRGQLHAVLTALQEVGRGEVPVVALAKETVTHQGELVRDRLFLPGRKNPKFFPANAPGWLLLLRLRDEAHRCAVSYHRRRARRAQTASLLTEIPGIGPARRKALLRRYASLEELRAAPLEDLASLPGFSHTLAARIREWLLKASDQRAEK